MFKIILLLAVVVAASAMTLEHRVEILAKRGCNEANNPESKGYTDCTCNAAGTSWSCIGSSTKKSGCGALPASAVACDTCDAANMMWKSCTIKPELMKGDMAMEPQVEILEKRGCNNNPAEKPKSSFSKCTCNDAGDTWQCMKKRSGCGALPANAVACDTCDAANMMWKSCTMKPDPVKRGCVGAMPSETDPQWKDCYCKGDNTWGCTPNMNMM